MKKDTNKQAKEFPVREGGENSSILHGKKPVDENKYPRRDEKAKQANNQPEFSEEQPNRKSPNTPANSKH